MATIDLRIVLVGAMALAWGLVGCGADRTRAARSSVTSAVAPSSKRSESSAAILSCRGAGLCREDILLADRPSDAVNEAIEDCTRRSGHSSPTPCPRAGALASCSLTGENGSITVYTYADAEEAAVSAMSERCEDFGGAFTLATQDR